MKRSPRSFRPVTDTHPAFERDPAPTTTFAQSARAEIEHRGIGLARRLEALTASPPPQRPASNTEAPPRALFIFSPVNCVGVVANRIAASKWFEFLILAAILANCVVMMAEVHLPNNDEVSAKQTEALHVAEIVFLVIFCFELIVKVLALGLLLHPGSYLRNGWNVLDFVVVVTGVMGVIPGLVAVNLRTLRALRVLRLFKLIRGVPSLHVVMSSILRATIPLAQVGVLILFATLIFAIMGMESYMGVFHQGCFKILEGRVSNQLMEERPCFMSEFDNDEASGANICPRNISSCQPGWTGPNFGITSFDNIGNALLTVFQCFTMEGWTDVMYWCDDALGNRWNWLFFLPLVVVGSFFMLNLVLGVLSAQFSNEKGRNEFRMQLLKNRRKQRFENEVKDYFAWMQAGEFEVEERKPPPLSRWRRLMKRLFKSQFWFWTIILLVFLNTLCTALEYPGQPQWMVDFLDSSELVFLLLFTIEVGLKMWVFGAKTFFASNFNTFDFLVIAGSIVDALVEATVGEALGFTVLRALRLLRIFKVTRYWKSLQSLAQSLVDSARSILSLLFLLLNFVVIFALLGMQLFGGRMNFSDGKPFANFDDFPTSMMSVFQILTGEDWNALMYDGIRGVAGDETPSWSNYAMQHCLYFILVVVLGNFTLLNVFLAIAVDNVGKAMEREEEEEMEEEKEKARKEEMERKRKFERDRNLSLSRDEREGGGSGGGGSLETKRRRSEEMESMEEGEKSEEEREEEENEEVVKTKYDYWSLFVFTRSNPIRRFCGRVISLRYFDTVIMIVIVFSSITLAAEDPTEVDEVRNQILEHFDDAFTIVFVIEFLLKVVDAGFVLHPGSYCRDPWNLLDLLVVAGAGVSFGLRVSASARCDELDAASHAPVDPDGVNATFDAVNASLFGNVSSALREFPSNASSATFNESVPFFPAAAAAASAAADALTTVASEVPKCTKTKFNMVKILRVLRVLRPLKSINRLPKLKAVFDCIVKSVRNVFGILVIYFFFQFIFASIGVELFSQKFWSCTDPSIHDEENCHGFYFPRGVDGNLEPRNWVLSEFNFENVLNATLTLFVVSTGEGWPGIYQVAKDATHVGKGPIIDFRKSVALYFVAFFVILPFFFVNVFVALIIITFQDSELEEAAGGELDKNQKSCIEFGVSAKMVKKFILEDSKSMRYWIWKQVTTNAFEYFILIMIAANTFVMSMEFYRPPHVYVSTLKYINVFFTVVFLLEAILKLSAFGIKGYFADGWNCWDFITVLGSILSLLFSELQSSLGSKVELGFLRLFRAARLVKLLRQGNSIRTLLWTFVQSFRSLPYVLLLIFFLFYAFAVVGMQMFGAILPDVPPAIDDHTNFNSFFSSMLLLFRCSTGESWHLIMLSAASPPKGSAFAYIYFTSFVFLAMFLFLNLFVAVIMDNFEYLTRDSAILGPHHLDEFVRAWSEADPQATGRLHYRRIAELMMNLEPPLGFGKHCQKKIVFKRLVRMDMPVDSDHTVHFRTTLLAIIRESLNVKMLADDDDVFSPFDPGRGGPRPFSKAAKDEELRALLRQIWPHQAKNNMEVLVPTVEPGQLTVGKIYSGIHILENWRQYRYGEDEEEEMAFGNSDTIVKTMMTKY